MEYDGIVTRLNGELYLFLFDPDTFEIKDGINISEHECYKDLKLNQLMVVSVTFKDGTEILDKVDLDEFIHGDSYGKYDIFIHIQDLSLFSIGVDDNFNDSQVSLKDIINKGGLYKLAIECINTVKNKMENNE